MHDSNEFLSYFKKESSNEEVLIWNNKEYGSENCFRLIDDMSSFMLKEAEITIHPHFYRKDKEDTVIINFIPNISTYNFGNTEFCDDLDSDSIGHNFLFGQIKTKEYLGIDISKYPIKILNTGGWH